MQPPREVLVTGGAGFIGSHLVDRLLDLGHRVVCLDDFNDSYDPAFKRQNVAPQLQQPGYELVEGDIRDTGLLGGLFGRHEFDAIIHLAARAGVSPSVRTPEVYQDINCRGTAYLLEMARRHNIEQFVSSSSSSVYGEAAKVPFNVDDPLGVPMSPYAATKRWGELLCRNYHRMYGLKMAMLRFFTVYGPRGRPDMSIRKFTGRVIRGEELPLYGDGTFQRDFTYVSDIVDGIVAVFERRYECETFNLGDCNPMTMNRLIELIEENVGKKAKVRHYPVAPGDISRTYADIDKSTRMLGYKPKVKIEEGIRRTVAWCREHE